MNDAAQDLREKRLDMWESIFWQCSVPIELGDVSSVIDFGSGRNLTKAILEHYQIKCTTVDVSDVYDPDVVSEIRKGLSLAKADMVCSFQCLEHNSYEKLGPLVEALASYSEKYVFISLPYDGAYLSTRFAFRAPFLSVRKRFSMRLCGFGGRKIDTAPFESSSTPHRYHWWEVGRRGLPIKKLVADITSSGSLRLMREISNTIYPHHIFFLFRKVS